MEFLADIHTKAVHFPIALLITYSFLEIIGIIFKKKLFTQSAFVVLITGIIGIFLSVLSGNQAFEAYQYWNETSSNIFNSHQFYANFTTWFFVFITALRTFLVVKKKFNGVFKYLFILFAMIGIFFIYKTAEYGGELINKFGVGTEYKNEQMQNNF
ncbi:MAG: DUF2231 domain-containing protein [Ignavibacteriaceae bacterium]|nr:DUF2231 domain-containing protein [Ignavibacteriaceae bacterium]